MGHRREGGRGPPGEVAWAMDLWNALGLVLLLTLIALVGALLTVTTVPLYERGRRPWLYLIIFVVVSILAGVSFAIFALY